MYNSCTFASKYTKKMAKEYIICIDMTKVTCISLTFQSNSDFEVHQTLKVNIMGR